MYPIIYITLSYIFGIIAQRTLILPLPVLLILSFILLPACLLLFSDKKRFQAAFVLLVFVLGMTLFAARGGPTQSNVAHPNEQAGPCFWLRNRLTDVVNKMLPPPYSSLLGSIVLGVGVSPPPPEMVEAYRKVGTIHLLVASGQQLSILVGCTMAVFRFLKLSPKLGSAVATALALLFTAVAGGGASIVRALIMSETVLAAGLLGRDSDALVSLSFSALLILLFDPKVLFNVGFQFSFAATYALLYLAPILEDSFPERVPQFFASTMSVSLAPLLLTVPIVAYNFSQFSCVAPLSNALVLPWIEFVVVLGFIAVGLGVLFTPLSYIFSGVLFVSLKVLDFIISGTAALPFASLNIKTPSLPLIVGYYMILAGGIHMMKNKIAFKFDRTKALVIVLALLSVLVWHGAVSQGVSSGALEIDVIDVGQGDSILIQSPSGRNILIDGGEKRAGKGAVIPFLRSKGINKLDMVVLTHPDSDHVGGLSPVLESIKAAQVLDSGQPCTSEVYRRFTGLIAKNKIKYSLARYGEILNLGGSVEARVLWPTGKFLTGTGSDRNNNSTVIKLIYGKFSMLLVGDLGNEGERELLRMKVNLASDILKVGHHGSYYSSSPAFLDAVRAKVAVISVGAGNKFGHPAGRTIEDLKSRNVHIFRTDLNGTVVIRTDGHGYFIEPAHKI